MTKHLAEQVDAHLGRNRGIISRARAVELGLTSSQVDWAVASGQWVVVHPGVYVLRGFALDGLGRAQAACLACGPCAVASHRSAALAWGLTDDAPGRPSVTVAWEQRRRLAGIDLHRSRRFDRRRRRVIRGVPVTDPLRTLVDLASLAASDELDEAVDRARQRRLVTIAGLQAEIARLQAPGRRGPSQLLAALRRRGFIEAPSPSVLESRVSRLLRSWGIEVMAVERSVLRGRYRVDFLLRIDVALEVDGYRHHSSPEAKAADARRRADLLAAGICVIEADWITVVHEPEELRRRIESVLAARPLPAAAGAPRPVQARAGSRSAPAADGGW